MEIVAGNGIASGPTGETETAGNNSPPLRSASATFVISVLAAAKVPDNNADDAGEIARLLLAELSHAECESQASQ